MTDLTTVRDHPAAVLANHPTLDSVTRAESAAVLRTYEQRHGVTFAALDNEALAAVREAYAVVTFYDDAFESAERDFKNAVRDLLGLED